MGSQPGTQQGPEALHRVDMNLIETIPVFIAGVFTPAMADGVMIKTPSRQGGVDILLIGMDPRSWGDERLDEWTDRHLLDLLQHPDDHGAPALNHAENGRFFLLQGSTPPCALQSPPPPPTAFFSPRRETLDDRPPRRPRHIPRPPTEPVRIDGRRSLPATAQSSAAPRSDSSPARGQSGRWIGSIP